ncbi:MAG: hypothetical protein U9O65_06385 [Thermotogota bacterium]|nr:hypothetical protein [Thermotogota bacterium]
MVKKCTICGQEIDKKNSVKIRGEWYCLECAAKLKELEEKSVSKKSYGKAPEVLALNVENPGIPVVRYFQMVTTTGIIHLGACDNYRNDPDENIDEIVASAMEGVYYKLLDDLKDKSYQIGANSILGIKVSTASFSTVEEELGLIVTLSGTPALTARKKEKSTEKSGDASQEKDIATQNDEFEFPVDFFDEKFEQIDNDSS